MHERAITLIIQEHVIQLFVFIVFLDGWLDKKNMYQQFFNNDFRELLWLWFKISASVKR